MCMCVFHNKNQLINAETGEGGEGQGGDKVLLSCFHSLC